MNVATMPVALVGCSPEEWQIRCDLAALYRLVAHHRWTDFVYTHISARLPGPDHHFLINKYGVLFHEMCASDLVKIDMHGNVVEAGDTSSRRVNAAGFTIHSAVHLAREDLLCVVHTHTQAGIAVSCMQEGLLPLSQHAMKFYGRLAYHGYEGIALDLDERQHLALAGPGQDGDAITVACEPTRCGRPHAAAPGCYDCLFLSHLRSPGGFACAVS